MCGAERRGNMSSDYENWERRLRGESVETYETEFDNGFYRQPIKDGRTTVGWRPVAFFPDELVPDRTMCLIGDTVVTDPHVMSEIWLHCVKYPISEENYRRAADEGVWWDADPTVTANREEGPKPQPSIDNLIGQIAEARKGVSSYLKIEDDETASKAQDLRSHLTTLAGKLDKERKELVQPHLDAQRDINGRLNPVIKDATEAAAIIKKSQEAWELTKRQSNSSNVPPPRAQIRGSTGRAAAVREAFDAVITDISAYFQTVKDRPEVTELLQKLAQKDIDAGLRPAGVDVKPSVRIR